MESKLGSRFKIGDKVRKVVGYPFEGTVVMVSEDQEKCSVRHNDGWEHIFSDKQLDYNHQEFQYLDLLKDCLENGVYREGRNGGTYGLFGRQIRFDLSQGFPLLTTKKMFTKGIIGELIWFLNGDTNIKYLKDNGISIWDEWADENGDLGEVYGAQWRKWETHRWGGIGRGYKVEYIDQIKNLIDGLKQDPYGRRHIVTAWNPGKIEFMALPPCHCLFQFFVSDDKLSCQLYQRSADIFLGVPFNIASYALLTHIIAKEVGLKVGEFVHSFGDVHLYADHVDQAKEQLSRTPYSFPQITFADKNIFDLEIEDFELFNYNCHPAIKAEVSA